MGSRRLADKKVRGFAVILAIAVIALTAGDASAMYNSALGRWMQREPGSAVGGPLRVGSAAPAVLGRFIPRDSFGQYADGLNLYRYAHSGPTTFVDPTGLIGEDCRE